MMGYVYGLCWWVRRQEVFWRQAVCLVGQMAGGVLTASGLLGGSGGGPCTGGWPLVLQRVSGRDRFRGWEAVD